MTTPITPPPAATQVSPTQSVVAVGDVLEGRLIAPLADGGLSVATRLGTLELPAPFQVRVGATVLLSILSGPGGLALAADGGPAQRVDAAGPVRDALAARNGTTIEARIAGLEPDGSVRITTPDGPAVLRAAIPFEPGGMLRMRVEATGSALRLSVVPDSAAPAASPAGAADPGESLLAPTIARAVAVQDGLAPLFAQLSALAGRPEGLPEPVARAVAQLLGLSLSADGEITAGAVRRAVEGSGLFLESALAQGLPPPAGDLKGAIGALLAALRGSAPHGSSPAGGPDRPAPPTGEGPLSPQKPANLDGPGAEDALQRLAERAEAALARMTLAQIAASPGEVRTPRHDAQPTHPLTVEIPVGLGQETAVAQMRIAREESAPGDAVRDGWVVRFAIDSDPAGPIHATIRLGHGRVAVAFHADSETTATDLAAGLPDLRDALVAADLKVGELVSRIGRPPEERTPPDPGRVLDRRS